MRILGYHDGCDGNDGHFLLLLDILGYSYTSCTFLKGRIADKFDKGRSPSD